MNPFLQGRVIGALLGLCWTLVTTLCVTVGLALSTGAAVTPPLGAALLIGPLCGLGLVSLPGARRSWSSGVLVALAVIAAFLTVGLGAPFGLSILDTALAQILALLALGLATAPPLARMLGDLPAGKGTRHKVEAAVIRFLMGFGYVLFSVIVAIPFYVMVMTSLKSQQALLANPLDFSIDLSQGWDLFRSYGELFEKFRFGGYLLTSAIVSVSTVLITLLFSVPGAYAVARLRFKGRSRMTRSILLIYTVPMIVLALPIYVAFSMLDLRNTLIGIIIIYPVTTIPVALYMLQGYFRGLPAEVEEAGLMDGLSRLMVIWKITLPLSLPALASVSLYVFMIAWNEFLLAFMLLDDPRLFTLTRGVAMLNSSEIPRQHLMAGAVVATIPIILIFLGLERFMTKGLTAGSVKG